MYQQYDEGPEFADEPVSGWIFNERREGVEYRTDLHPSDCGLVGFDWRDSTPESEAHFNRILRREIFASETDVLDALRGRFERKIKRSQGFLKKIEKRLAVLIAAPATEGGQK